MESVSGTQDMSAETSYKVPPENKARVSRKDEFVKIKLMPASNVLEIFEIPQATPSTSAKIMI